MRGSCCNDRHHAHLKLGRGRGLLCVLKSSCCMSCIVVITGGGAPADLTCAWLCCCCCSWCYMAAHTANVAAATLLVATCAGRQRPAGEGCAAGVSNEPVLLHGALAPAHDGEPAGAAAHGSSTGSSSSCCCWGWAPSTGQLWLSHCSSAPVREGSSNESLKSRIGYQQQQDQFMREMTDWFGKTVQVGYCQVIVAASPACATGCPAAAAAAAAAPPPHLMGTRPA